MTPRELFSGTTGPLWFARLVALGVLFIGLKVIVDWKLHPTWGQDAPGVVLMNPLTALGFVLTALCLWLVTLKAWRAWQPVLWLISVGLMVLGVSVCTAWIAERDFFFDDWLFQWLYQNPGLRVNNIAVPTAMAFLLLGAAFLLLDFQSRRRRWPAEGLILFAFLISAFSVLSYFYGIQDLQFNGWKAQMALNTAATFMLLCLGIWSARPDRGILSLMRQNTSGGLVARQLIPAAIAVPAMLSWFRYNAVQQFWFSEDFGVVLVAVGNMGILGVLLGYLAWALHRNDLKQRQLTAQLQNSEARLRSILVNAHDAIITLDASGTIISWNRAASELYGYTEEEMLGQPASILSPVHLRNPQPQQPASAPEIGLTAEHQGLRKDGTTFPIEYSIAHWDLPEGRFYTSVVRDITERKRAEQQLQDLNQSLEARAQELNLDLTEKARELERANRELEAFAFSVSHDLRAPLRSLNGFSQALLEDYQDSLDRVGQDYLQRIKKSSDRMARLIDDILQLSRLSRAELQYRPVDLTAIAHSVLEELRSTDPLRQVQLDIEPGLHTRGDPGLLRVVLQNLLGNAWKFTSKVPDARIQLGSRQEGTEKVFFVSDNGAGFDMDHAERLFGAFQRLHSTADFEGTGIGLASVQRVIHRHHGRVWAHSEVGKGATFFFTLGLPQAPAAEPETNIQPGGENP